MCTISAPTAVGPPSRLGALGQLPSLPRQQVHVVIRKFTDICGRTPVNLRTFEVGHL